MLALASVGLVYRSFKFDPVESAWASSSARLYKITEAEPSLQSSHAFPLDTCARARTDTTSRLYEDP